MNGMNFTRFCKESSNRRFRFWRFGFSSEKLGQTGRDWRKGPFGLFKKGNNIKTFWLVFFFWEGVS